MVSAYQVTVKFVIFYSVHILQLDITNKKDIENVVGFITDTVGSEGKCHIVFLFVYDSNESKMPFISVTCLFTKTIQLKLDLQSAHTYATQRSNETPVQSHEFLSNQKTAYASALH